MHNHVWVETVGETSESEIPKAYQFRWAHAFSLEDFTSKVGVSIKVFESVGSVHFLAKVLLGVIEELKVLSFDLERECLMLFN